MSPKKAIFFDIDDTLIATKSMFDFMTFLFNRTSRSAETGARRMQDFRRDLAEQVPDGRREDLNRAFYRHFAGYPVQQIEPLADEWFRALPSDIWIDAAVELLVRKRQEGYLIVGVSGSSHEILRGVRAALRLDHLLAAKLERVDGRFTGELIPPQTIGAGKEVAMRQLAAREGIDLSASAACGDHISDLSMLEAVGEQFVVAGDPALEAIATARGWPLLPRSALVDADMHV